MRNRIAPATLALFCAISSLFTQGCGNRSNADLILPAMEILAKLDNCGFTQERREEYIPRYHSPVRFYGAAESVAFTEEETSTTLQDAFMAVAERREYPDLRSLELLLGLARANQDNPCLNSPNIRLSLAELVYKLHSEACAYPDTAGSVPRECTIMASFGTIEAYFQIANSLNDNAVRLFERQHSAVNDLHDALTQLSSAVDAAGIARTAELDQALPAVAALKAAFDAALEESADDLMAFSNAADIGLQAAADVLPIALEGWFSQRGFSLVFSDEVLDVLTNSLNRFAEGARAYTTALQSFVEQSQLPLGMVNEVEDLANLALSDYDFRPGAPLELNRAAIRLQDVLVEILPEYSRSQTALRGLGGSIGSEFSARVQRSSARIEDFVR